MSTLTEEIQKLPLRVCDPGDVVIRQGERDGRVYILSSGTVEVLKDDVKIAEVSEEGAVFGEMSLLLQRPATATVQAVEKSTFYLVEQPSEFLRAHPEVSLYVAKLLARRLESLNRYLVDVRNQFKEYDDHVGMIDGVLDTLMSKHPRLIERRPAPEYD